jgi:hypothetical protein
MTTRITFTLEKGPLDGTELRHRPIPEKPEEPMLYKLTKGAKDHGPDYIAQGWYFLEQRDGQWVGIHHPSDDDQPWRLKPVEEKPKEEAKENKVQRKGVPGREPVEIPADTPGGRNMAKRAKAKQILEAALKKQHPPNSK